MKLEKIQKFAGIVTIKKTEYNVEFVPATTDRDDNEGVLCIRPGSGVSLTYKSALKFLAGLEDAEEAPAKGSEPEKAPTSAAEAQEPAPAPQKRARAVQTEIPGSEEPAPKKTRRAPESNMTESLSDDSLAEFKDCASVRSAVTIVARKLGDSVTREKVRNEIMHLRKAGVSALVAVDEDSIITMANRAASGLGIEE